MKVKHLCCFTTPTTTLIFANVLPTHIYAITQQSYISRNKFFLFLLGNPKVKIYNENCVGYQLFSSKEHTFLFMKKKKVPTVENKF